MDGAALSPRTGKAATTTRCGVVDLGSNSVRRGGFEGRGRNPVTIFNEKAVLGLGRGLHDTGQLNADAVAQALQPVPPLAARVNDLTGTLDAATQARLESLGFDPAAGTPVSKPLRARAARRMTRSNIDRVPLCADTPA
jgi:hypothetical protein